MTNQSENTRRIARNTLLLYGRMLFGMLVSLYTSRVILDALGVVDFGIANVVGGLVAMFSLISSSLTASSARFLTFELGKGDPGRLRRVFSTSLTIHVLLSVVVLLVAETVGLWFLNTHMTIPAGRMCAANWIYQFSVFSFVIGLFSVTFNSTIVSHEHMSVYAFAGILEIILRLCIVLFIAYSPFAHDKLIAYSLLLLLLGSFMKCYYYYYCKKHFEECSLKLSFDRGLLKSMGSFAGWNFIGCSAALLKDQGVNVLLNIFVGPVLNAARGISTSVNTAIMAFVNNFMTALNPQITKSYASGEHAYMMSLVERGSRFSFYILFVLALPVLLETEFVLGLWLVTFPEHTVSFVRLMLVLLLSDVLSNTLITMQLATGKIRSYQIAVGGMLMLNFPLSYICLKLGCQPESVYVVAIAVSVLCMFLRMAFLRKMVVAFSARSYIRRVCLNVASVSGIAIVAPMFLHGAMEIGWLRFASVTAVSVICSILSVCFVGCTAAERQFIFEKATAVKRRFLG